MLDRSFVAPSLLVVCGMAWAGEPPHEFVGRAGELEFSGRLIVRAKREAVAGAGARLAGMVVCRYGDVGEDVIAVPARYGGPGTGEAALARELMATGLFEYAHPDWICYPVGGPDDPLYGSQWHHAQMGSLEAWEITRGAATVVCAFTDTGIDLDHADLAAHRVSGYDAVANLAEVDGGDVNDIHGHGTHVAGCAAAIGGNGEGVAGAAWDVKIMMVRVALGPDGGAYLSDILEGARWAAAHGARVVSSSYSGVNGASVGTTGAYIRSLGGLYLYAAGNSNKYMNGFDHADTVVVGATTYADAKASFSSHGPAVDLFAPGVDILSTCWDGDYCVKSGTSMATPLVNGVAGLVWSAAPGLTSEQVEAVLEKTCVDLGDAGDDHYWGWGRMDAAAAVRRVVNSGGPVAPVAVDDRVDVPEGMTGRIDVLANDFDGNRNALRLREFDAVTAQGGVVELSAGTGENGRDEVVYTPPAGYTGADRFGYVLGDPTGRTCAGTVIVTVEGADAYRAPEDVAGATAGLAASYYVAEGWPYLPDFELMSPYARGIAASVDFPRTAGEFGASGRGDGVGAVFEGYIAVPETAEYFLFTDSDEGSELWIGDTLVVMNNGLHTMQEVVGRIKLAAGLHPIRVDYWEDLGDAGLIVSIQGGGLSKQVVPESMFAHAPCVADFNGDGVVDVFDVLDYQSAFNNGDERADVNGDGSLNIFDFMAFQTAFGDGCG